MAQHYSCHHSQISPGSVVAPVRILQSTLERGNACWIQCECYSGSIAAGLGPLAGGGELYPGCLPGALRRCVCIARALSTACVCVPDPTRDFAPSTRGQKPRSRRGGIE